jgi:WD40 repeat protein
MPVNPYASLRVDAECGPVFFSPDGSMLVTSGKQRFQENDGPLRVWDVAQGRERFCFASGWRAVETVLFSPDSSLLAAHEQAGDLKIWSTSTGEEVAAFKPATWSQNRVNFRFSPDGRFLVFEDFTKGSHDEDYLTFWHIGSKQERGSVEGYLWSLAFSPDGESFATFRRRDHGKAIEVMLWKMQEAPK